MRNIYGDLHIHVGSAGGRAVKITASRKLDLYSVLFDAAPRKGLDMVGIVDAGSILVSAEIEAMLEKGDLREHPRGGMLARNGVLLIPGCEVESREGVHLILYLPRLKSIKDYQKYMRSRVSNMTLSTQRADVSIAELINLSLVLDGIFCPAHAFTPHKGIYGFLTRRLGDELGRDAGSIKVLELGLSADTDMAGMIGETRDYTFLSNSDAHSADNIGREYNLLRMADKNFQELGYCLENFEGRRVLANYGMDPLMGKYHRSYCTNCMTISSDAPPVLRCSRCGNDKLVMGVYDRIIQIRDQEEPRYPVGRPPYNYRVPLKDLPGVGPKLREKLMASFHNEINLLEKASKDDIERVAGAVVASYITRMRVGRLPITPGGGGKYGRVRK
ncbi:endonuclease Q family protein [Syntrophomonas curvata]